jgi:GT2 family glycosyltransferase
MKVISFCLWGNKPIYNQGLIENLKLSQIYYPDWTIWIYIHSKSVPIQTIAQISLFPNIKIIFKTEEEIRPKRNMLWRFEPADDPQVTHFMSRDTDSRISPREVFAVYEWLESEKTLHIMRDHPQHYNKILGGMFGLKCEKLIIAKNPNLTWREEVENFYKFKTENEDDQNFLEIMLYNKFLNDCIIHDEIKRYEGTYCKPFPIQYEKSCHFVGCYVNEYNQIDKQTTDILHYFLTQNLPHRISNRITIFEDTVKKISSIIHHIYTIGQNNSLQKTLLNRLIPVSVYSEKSLEKGISLVVKQEMIFTPEFIYELEKALESPSPWDNIKFGNCYLQNIKNPKISIIIPTFNRYKYLLNAINSVKEQTYKEIELIVINDSSTQPEYYSKELRDIMPPKSILIHMTTNSGDVLAGRTGKAAYTKNIGIKISTGEYIAFLDDDDYWKPEKLQKQLDAMTNTGCKMSCTDGYIGKGPYNHSSIYNRYYFEYEPHRQYIESNLKISTFPTIWNKNFLQIHNFCINSSVIIHKDIIDKIGYISHKQVGEDYDYWLKAIAHTNCVYIDIPLIYYDSSHGDGQLY